MSGSTRTRWGFSLRLSSENSNQPCRRGVAADQTSFGTPCPLWVKSRHDAWRRDVRSYHESGHQSARFRMSALCQKRTFALQGRFLNPPRRFQRWLKFNDTGVRNCANILVGLWGFQHGSPKMCDYSLGVSGRGLRRLATNSPHVNLVPAPVGSLRRKMFEWRFAFFREPSLRLPAR